MCSIIQLRRRWLSLSKPPVPFAGLSELAGAEALGWRLNLS